MRVWGLGISGLGFRVCRFLGFRDMEMTQDHPGSRVPRTYHPLLVFRAEV